MAGNAHISAMPNKKPIELPPDVAKAFAEDMRAYPIDRAITERVAKIFARAEQHAMNRAFAPRCEQQTIVHLKITAGVGVGVL